MTNETTASAPLPLPGGKQRSPNYPAFNLRKAMEKVAQLHEKARMSPVPAPIACDYLGVRSTSSSGMRCIATLQEFGLASAEGRGTAKTLKVTELARMLLKHPDHTAAEYKAALHKAALSPRIHQKMWAKWGDAGLPPDEALKYELESTEWGFTEAAAEAVIAEFRETLEFAGLTDGGDGGETVDTGDQGEGDAHTLDRPPPPPKKEASWMPTETASSKVIPLPLQSGGTAVLHLPYPLNEEDYDWMTKLLDGLKASLLSRYAIRVGDPIQWTSQGADQFPEPVPVVRIQDGYVFVDGSEAGIPIGEIRRA